MRSILLFLLIFYSSSLLAKGKDIIIEPVAVITSLQLVQLFDEENKIDVTGLVDLIDKEQKVSLCSEEYVKKQSKSYSKIAQVTLYDLIHNFDSIASRVYGKKVLPDDMPYVEKLEALARVQCEAYYKMGILK